MVLINNKENQLCSYHEFGKTVITDNNKLAILVLSSNDLEPVTQDKKPLDSNIKHSILFSHKRKDLKHCF